MARMTDNEGNLLGGLTTSLAWLLRSRKIEETTGVPAPPPPPEYGANEIVFGLECSYGSLARLTLSSGPTPAASPDAQELPRPRDCQELVEVPGERHHCLTCGGYYCAEHASPTAHDCAALIKTQ